MVLQLLNDFLRATAIEILRNNPSEIFTLSLDTIDLSLVNLTHPNQQTGYFHIPKSRKSAR